MRKLITALTLALFLVGCPSWIRSSRDTISEAVQNLKAIPVHEITTPRKAQQALIILQRIRVERRDDLATRFKVVEDEWHRVKTSPQSTPEQIQSAENAYALMQDKIEKFAKVDKDFSIFWDGATKALLLWKETRDEQHFKDHYLNALNSSVELMK